MLRVNFRFLHIGGFFIAATILDITYVRLTLGMNLTLKEVHDL